MKKTCILIFTLMNVLVFSQQKIEQLQYAHTLITVPEKCVAKSEYEILDCKGFSAQWLFLSEEMLKQKVDQQIFSQFEAQIKFKTKKPIKFLSQNQTFSGDIYRLKNGSVRIIALGRVDEIPLILNLGFNKEIKSNEDLTDFEQKFIKFN